MGTSHLDDLRAKYAELLRLRREHDACRACGVQGPAPREALAALASRFPGALRELDELPLDVLHERLGALARAAEDPSAVRPWMEAMAAFHALARGALCAKRWLAGASHVDASTRERFLREVGTLAYPEDARLWADDLPAIARPPGGRLLSLVFERLGHWLGATAAEARALVLPRSRGARGRVPA